MRDRQLLEQASAGRLLGADYLATLLAIASSAGCAALVRRVRRALGDLPATMRAGAGELPESTGVLVRVTTDGAPDLQRAQSLLLDELLIRSRPREEHPLWTLRPSWAVSPIRRSRGDVGQDTLAAPLFTSAHAAEHLLADLGVTGKVADIPLAPHGWSRTSGAHTHG